MKGLIRHPLYKRWKNMRNRCNNKNNPSYKNYGGRGIKVCAEWDDFINFYNWSLLNGWDSSLQIDRINNNGNYEPLNCRFVTPSQNRRNKRDNILISFNGETKLLKEWCEDLELNYQRIYQRIFKLKVPIERAFVKESYYQSA